MDGTGGGLQQTAEDLDQRAFPGPVFADQGVHFTRHQVEINLVQRQHARELFVDLSSNKYWFHRIRFSAHFGFFVAFFAQRTVRCAKDANRPDFSGHRRERRLPSRHTPLDPVSPKGAEGSAGFPAGMPLPTP